MFSLSIIKFKFEWTCIIILLECKKFFQYKKKRERRFICLKQEFLATRISQGILSEFLLRHPDKRGNRQ